MTFQEKLDSIVATNNSLLCIGMDADIDKLPDQFQTNDHPQFAFNKWVIDQTSDVVCAYKPNSAFYEARGAQGVTELHMTCSYLQKEHPDIPIILDTKRGDIGNTNDSYAQYVFDYLGADAITVHPYLGQEANASFLQHKDKGIFILCRTSNPGAAEFQDVIVNIPPPMYIGDPLQKGDLQNVPLYQYVAKQVASHWNTNKNCFLVVGATYPKELAEIRALVGDMPILVPGIGVQGGDVEKTVHAGLTTKKRGIIVNAGRSIIFAHDPRSEAEALRDTINSYR